MNENKDKMTKQIQILEENIQNYFETHDHSVWQTWLYMLKELQVNTEAKEVKDLMNTISLDETLGTFKRNDSQNSSNEKLSRYYKPIIFKMWGTQK